MTQQLSLFDDYEKSWSNIDSSGLQLVTGANSSSTKGVPELLTLYSQAPWLRSVIHKISHAVSTTDWRLFVRVNSQGRAVRDKRYQTFKHNREKELADLVQVGNAREVVDHPFLDLIERGTGNEEILGGQEVLQITQMHYDLVGEAFWLIQRDALGVPYAIWPLPPHWINRFPIKGDPYYELSLPGSSLDQEFTRIPVTEIIPFIDPNPANPYMRGVGAAHSLADELEVDEFAAKHIRSFFQNRARPDLIIFGEGLQKSDTDRLEQKWLDKHSGFWKQFKPLFMNRKVEVKELGQTFESMQMTELRKQERDAILNTLGVPPEKFGILSSSNKATINAADFFWTQDVIKPRIDTLARQIQRKLIPMFDDRLILTYNSPTVQDDEHKLEVRKAAPWATTLNEWREEQGLPPLGAKGESLLVPTNHVLIPLEEGGLEGSTGDGGSGSQSGDDDSENGNEDENGVQEEDVKQGVEKALRSMHQKLERPSFA